MGAASREFREIAARAWIAALVGVAALAPSPARAEPPRALPGHLHGTVETRDGKLTGAIVLGDTDNRFWDDVLHARRVEPLPGAPEDKERPFRFRIFGFDFSGSSRETYGEALIPFGRIAELHPKEDNEVRVVLKGGAETVLRSRGQEFGDSMQPVRVIAEDGTETEVPWHRIVRIDFSPGAVPGVTARRLFGTVETEGGSWTGPLRWDRDESVLDDKLDGHVDDRDREVLLADVAEVAPANPDASRVTLRDGSVLLLGGTNDVNRHNRGIEVGLADGVRIIVPWERVQRVVFSDAASDAARDGGAQPRYEDFDGGRPIRGRVATKDGRTLVGRLAWDLDERWDWETLEGTEDWLEWSISFREIRTLEPRGDRTRVVLRDGTERLLTGSNDVNHRNRGMRVWLDDGTTVDLHWASVESVSLETTTRTPAAGSGRRDPA